MLSFYLMKICQYQNPESTLTLQEGLDEYFKVNPHLLLPANLDEKSAQFFRCHDRVHVVFGCDTSFLNEAMADWWTIFGADIPFFQYLGYMNNPNVKQILKEFQAQLKDERVKSEVLKSIVPIFTRAFFIYLRTKRMTKPWPFFKSDDYLNQKLCDIRKEFNIQIF